MAKKNKRSILYQSLLVIGIVVVVNIIADKAYFRLDLTEDKQYTLSSATKDILHSLNEPVTITAYFTEDIPPQLLQARKEFKDMLIEYSNASGGNVVYEFIDPNKDQQSEQKAIQEGIRPSIVNVRERDQMTQKRVFLGAILKMGSRREIIPMIQTGTAMEYELSSSIKKLSIVDKPMIGYLQGNGEPARNALQQVMAGLDVLYNIEDVNLSDASKDLSKYKTIIIMGPTDTIPDSQLQMLDTYLAGGGNLFIGYNRVLADFSQARGYDIHTGLEDWLSGKGMLVNKDFLIDANCGSVGVQQKAGSMNFTTNVRFPYLPIITTFSDHPITKGLEQVLLPLASTISFTGDSSLTYTPIAFSSDKSGTKTPPLYFDINHQWTDADFPLSHLTVAAILSGKISGDKESKIVLVGDADFAVNGTGQRPQQLQPDNVNLMVNGVDWLSDQTGLIALRTKGITSRPLESISESRVTFLKWMNFTLPIILIILFGIILKQRNRRIRIKRMEEGYV